MASAPKTLGGRRERPRNSPALSSTRVVINKAIVLRGRSGSARGVAHIEQGIIDAGLQMTPITPSATRGRSRLVNAARATRWDLWEAGRLAGAGAVLLSPCNVGLAPPSCANLLWMHDTMVLDHPEWFDRGFSRYAQLLFGLSARHCSRVITPSRYSAGRISDHWPGARPIEVLPWPGAPKTSMPRTLPPRPWQVVMVAATEAHKNHAAAIDAVAAARGILGEDIRLAVIGPPGRREDEVMRYIRVADPDAVWVQRLVDVSDGELERTYRSAWLVIQPSLDEGYCLPLMEAAAQGTPAVHSGRGAMPDVVRGVNARSVMSPQLCRHIVELSQPDRYTEASRAALADCGRMSPARFSTELARLIEEVRPVRGRVRPDRYGAVT